MVPINNELRSMRGLLGAGLITGGRTCGHVARDRHPLPYPADVAPVNVSAARRSQKTWRRRIRSRPAAVARGMHHDAGRRMAACFCFLVRDSLSGSY
jgi:hypothetical protein